MVCTVAVDVVVVVVVVVVVAKTLEDVENTVWNEVTLFP